MPVAFKGLKYIKKHCILDQYIGRKHASELFTVKFGVNKAAWGTVK